MFFGSLLLIALSCSILEKIRMKRDLRVKREFCVSVCVFVCVCFRSLHILEGRFVCVFFVCLFLHVCVCVCVCVCVSETCKFRKEHRKLNESLEFHKDHESSKRHELHNMNAVSGHQ